MLFPALWYFSGIWILWRRTLRVFSPELSSFLSTNSFLMNGLLANAYIVPSFSNFGSGSRSGHSRYSASLWSPYLDLGSRAGNGPMIWQIPIQFSLCIMNTAWVLKSFPGVSKAQSGLGNHWFKSIQPSSSISNTISSRETGVSDFFLKTS